MNYKTISSKAIVERIFGLLGNTVSQDSDRLLGNVIEWIGGGLELIGILPALERFDHNFIVSNGRVEIPCNLYLIESIAYEDRWLPYGSGTFNYDLHCENCVNEFVKYDLPYSYIANNNWIQTNIPDGETICLSWRGFTVDEDGFPLIPEKETVKQALFWFCLRNLMLGGFEHPNRDLGYNSVDANWTKYCGMASADLALLDKPQLETFRRSWVRLISQTQFSATTFFGDNSDERLLQTYNSKRV